MSMVMLGWPPVLAGSSVYSAYQLTPPLDIDSQGEWPQAGFVAALDPGADDDVDGHDGTDQSSEDATGN